MHPLPHTRLLQVALIGLAGILVFTVWFGLSAPKPTSSSESIRTASEVVEKKLDRSALWLAISARLHDDREKRTKALPEQVDNALKRLDSVLEGRDSGIRDFAKSSIGWSSIWSQVQSQVSNAARDEHHVQIRERFEVCVFKGDELQSVIEEIVRAFVEALDAEDARLLESIRLDVLNAGSRMPDAASKDRFLKSYQSAVSKTIERMSHSIGESVDRVLIDTVALSVAKHVAGKLAKGLALRAGVAIAAGPATFGIGTVAVIVVSLILDAILPNATDPVEAIAGQIREILLKTIHDLKEGDSEWKDKHFKLDDLARHHRDKLVREDAREVAALIEHYGHLGLRRELFRIAEKRMEMRRAALADLIQGEMK